MNNDQNYTGYSRRQIIKIFTQEGVQENSDITIPYTVGSWFLKDLKGKTILPDGTEIALSKDNIKVKTLKMGKRKVRVKSATFPGVVPGAVIAWSSYLKLESNTFLVEDTWNIQGTLPVLKSKYVLKHGRFHVDWTQTGMEKVDVEITEPSKRELLFIARNVPPLPDEPYGPADRAVRARVYFYLPELQEKWLHVFAGKFSGLTGRFIENAPGVAEKARELVSPSDPLKAKVRKIYEFVQREIGSEEQRLAETEGSQLEDARNAGEVLSQGFGNEFERTLLFLALVKEAGLEHALMLISSRYNGPLDPEVPDEDVFDSFAAAVKTEGGWTTYDPATRHCPPGMISPEKEGGAPNGIMLFPDKNAGAERKGKIQDFLTITTNAGAPYSIVDVEFSRSRKNVLTREATVRIAPDGSAVVEMSEEGTGQADLSQREAYEFLDEKERREKLEKKMRRMLPGMDLLEVSFEDIPSFDENAIIRCKMRLSDLGSRVPGRLIVTPSVFHANSSNPFTSEERKTPVHFSYARQIVERISFELPDGYELDELPAPTVIREPPFALVMSFQPTENGFRFSRRLDIGTAFWPVEEYERLRSFYEKLHKADRQAVILKKRVG